MRGNLNLASYNHYLTPNSQVMDCLSGNVAGRTAARSYHPGGVNTLYVDGHVQFAKDTVHPNTWRAISTRADGEIVSADQL